jgi:hypothetical protein
VNIVNLQKQEVESIVDFTAGEIVCTAGRSFLIVKTDPSVLIDNEEIVELPEISPAC